MKVEPWPLAIAGLLAAMISVCVLFWAISVRHADVELLPGGRPGLSAPEADERR